MSCFASCRKLPVLLFVVFTGPLAVAAEQLTASSSSFTVEVVDIAGNPVLNADVAVVLSTGAHQKDKSDEKGRTFFQKPRSLAELWLGAFGFEARTANYRGENRVTVKLTKRESISSAVVRGSTKLEGTGGAIEVHFEGGRNPYMYGTPFGFIQNGKTAGQPVHFKPKQPVVTVSPEGRKFRIYVLRGEQTIALVEYSSPTGK